MAKIPTVLTSGEAAERIGVSLTYVKLMRKAGRIQPVAQTLCGWPVYEIFEVDRLKRDIETRRAARAKKRALLSAAEG